MDRPNRHTRKIDPRLPPAATSCHGAVSASGVSWGLLHPPLPLGTLQKPCVYPPGPCSWGSGVRTRGPGEGPPGFIGDTDQHTTTGSPTRGCNDGSAARAWGAQYRTGGGGTGGGLQLPQLGIYRAAALFFGSNAAFQKGGMKLIVAALAHRSNIALGCRGRPARGVLPNSLVPLNILHCEISHSERSEK